MYRSGRNPSFAARRPDDEVLSRFLANLEPRREYALWLQRIVSSLPEDRSGVGVKAVDVTDGGMEGV